MYNKRMPLHEQKVRVTNPQLRGRMKVGTAYGYGLNAYHVIFDDRESLPYEGFYYETDVERYAPRLQRTCSTAGARGRGPWKAKRRGGGVKVMV